MSCLTPDLVEWLLADKKVCQRWKSLARRLNLGWYIPNIERLRGDESGQLRMVMRLWRDTFPDSYTVRGCKNMLAAEGLHHMCLWLNLMTQSSSSNSTTPDSQLSTPWSGYLYNQSLPGSSRAHSYTSDYYSNTSTPDASRPSSCQSDYQNSRASSQQSDYNFYRPHQTYSCPSTPLSHRRNYETLPTPHTKPGRISPSPSSSNIPHINKTAPDNKTIYNLLYKPDLIKLSSPRIVRKATRKSDILSKRPNNTVLKRNHSKSLSDLKTYKFTNLAGELSEGEHKSDHEKEILKLCDEIMSINCFDFDEEKTYVNIKKDTEPKKASLEKNTNIVTCSISDKTTGVVEKTNLAKSNCFSVHQVKTVHLTSAEKKQKTKPVVSNSEYFDNLVNIIDKAIQDLSS